MIRKIGFSIMIIVVILFAGLSLLTWWDQFEEKPDVCRNLADFQGVDYFNCLRTEDYSLILSEAFPEGSSSIDEVIQSLHQYRVTEFDYPGHLSAHFVIRKTALDKASRSVQVHEFVYDDNGSIIKMYTYYEKYYDCSIFMTE